MERDQFGLVIARVGSVDGEVEEEFCSVPQWPVLVWRAH